MLCFMLIYISGDLDLYEEIEEIEKRVFFFDQVPLFVFFQTIIILELMQKAIKLVLNLLLRNQLVGHIKIRLFHNTF